MPRDKALSDPVEASDAQVPLRAYYCQDRANKRISATLPEHLSHSGDLIKPDSQGAGLRFGQPDLGGRKRRRTTTPSGKTPTDMFWEHLSSSAPAFTGPPEMDNLEPGIPVKAEEDADATPIDKQSHNVEAGGTAPVKHGNHGPKVSIGQYTHDTPLQLMTSKDAKQDDRSLEEPDNEEDLPHRRLFDDTAFTPSPKLPIKRGRLLCLSLPPEPKTRRARRLLEVDESLSVVGATSTSTKQGSTIPAVQRKDSDPPKFRKLKVSKETRNVRSSDGFERDEARTGFLSKRRRTDGNDLRIGPLELTQKSITTQKKTDGPTWMRGQKTPRVATMTSAWSRKGYFSALKFPINSDEDIGAGQLKQSKSLDKETRNRSKRRASHTISDDEEPMVLPVPCVSIDEHNAYSDADNEIARTSFAKHDKDFPYISDGDESVILLLDPAENEHESTPATVSRIDIPGNDAHSDDATEGGRIVPKKHDKDLPYISGAGGSVDLLVFPSSIEDQAALATIPRTDTPKNSASIAGDENDQLPPKEWMLNVSDYDQDTLALRPDSREWTREVEIPDTSPRK